MSAGPIRAWRDSWLPPRVSEVKGKRSCAQEKGTPNALCGRRRPEALVAGGNYALVNCPECIAAIRADEGAIA